MTVATFQLKEVMPMKETSKSLRKEIANVHLCYFETNCSTCGFTVRFNQAIHVYRQEKAEIVFKIDKNKLSYRTLSSLHSERCSRTSFSFPLKHETSEKSSVKLKGLNPA